MSEAELTLESLEQAGDRSATAAGWFAAFEQWLSQVGDHLNPILVKEARQALKSRQFSVTFLLVLSAAWCWSIMGLAMLGPGVYWSSDGPTMFFGYFLILAVPLIMIVPYSTFRSLSAEREDKTFELLSITTLKSRQIISGKLAAAALQMVIYLSAVAPCLAFTYLLRGLDIVTIFTLLGYLCLACMGLALLCLMLATSTTEKYQQVVLSVGLIIGLAYSVAGAGAVAGEMLRWNAFVNDEEFWVVNAFLLTFYLSTYALFYLAAAAQLAFAGSNRSTGPRVVMAIQQALFIGWAGGLLCLETGPPSFEFLGVCLVVSGVYWFAMGVLLTGESDQLSPRVKRDLPQSFLGRAFLTWFNPGPASGYMFVISNFLTGALIATVAAIVFENSPWSRHTYGGSRDQVFLIAGLGVSYLAFYLGLGRLVLGLLARGFPISIAARLLVHALLLFLGTMVPITIHLMLPTLRNHDYSSLQFTNPFWTVVEAFDNRPSFDAWQSLVLLALAAVVVFAMNLPACAREARQTRISLPSRVQEEDAQQAALATPALGPVRTNPWDGDD